MRVEFKKIVDHAIIPTFAHDTDAGMDVYSCSSCVIHPGERALVPTGVAMQMKFTWYERLERMLFKTKYVLSARCKSGRALKEGFMLTNGEGTIDEDYRGEIQCIVTNSGSDDIVIERGQKIFQGIVQKLPWVDISEVNKLDLTERGNGGFGSTGL